MSIKLGDKVTDKVTGFTGIVTARCEWITGHVQIEVAPLCEKDGKMVDDKWLDENRLEKCDAV